WAPKTKSVRLRLESKAAREFEMKPEKDGWFALAVPEARPGDRYRYVIEGLAVPDPAARWPPKDVDGPSEVIDAAAYEWRDDSWRGRPWEEIVLYELHVGTFSASGDFAGVEKR